MYILKQHAFKIASSVFIVLILASTIITIKLFSAQADSSTVIPLDHGGTEVTARTTNYSGDDTNPPSDAIDWPANAGYPTVHNTVGGSGTFADPITVAINSKNGPDGDVPDGPYQIGENSMFHVCIYTLLSKTAATSILTSATVPIMVAIKIIVHNFTWISSTEIQVMGMLYKAVRPVTAAIHR